MGIPTAQGSSFDAWLLPPVRDAVFLTGPTASGKTEVALDLAARLNAEIVSMDSMAVYRDMDIGTAKPTLDQLRAVPHHLIDVVEPTDDYSLAQYVAAAHRTADEIRGRGRSVLFVGGTPLYLKSLLRGMFVGPPPDEAFRAAVEADVAEFGIDTLRQRLKRVDPLSAFRIAANDQRRMIRALEVARATGTPLSHWQTQFERVACDPAIRVFALGWPRGVLHERVERRVDRMLGAGLVEEVRSLLAKYERLGKTASQAVGYKEPIEYLAGRLDRDRMREQIIFHSRQFVRRQEMWLRSLEEVRRVEVASACDLAAAADRMLAA